MPPCLPPNAAGAAAGRRGSGTNERAFNATETTVNVFRRRRRKRFPRVRARAGREGGRGQGGGRATVLHRRPSHFAFNPAKCTTLAGLYLLDITHKFISPPSVPRPGPPARLIQWIVSPPPP